jgi:cytochrome c oxidase assembly protein subunit 15
MTNAEKVLSPRKPDLDPVASPASESVALHAFSKVVAFCAFCLLIAGGLVTSTGSSLSVPDWPLSFGKVLPPMIGGVAFEHGHRMIAGVVAALTWSLTGWLAAREPRAWVRRLGYAASGAILLQALLGGATVLLRLPPAVSISHACLAQAVFCLLVAIAQATSPWFQERSVPGAGTVWKAGAAAIGALYLQLVWGALLRHTGQGLMLHMAWAGAATFAVLIASTRGINARRQAYGLANPSTLLSLLIPIQLCLGYFAYRVRFSPDFVAGFSRGALLTTAHLALGATLLATSVTFTLRAYRSR